MKTQRSILTLTVLVLMSLVSGCTKKIYVPLESHSILKDSIKLRNERIDSLIFRDSVVIIERGDTLRELRVRERWKIRERIDTVYLSRRDTLIQEKPVGTESHSHSTRSGFGIVAPLILLVGVVIVFIMLKGGDHQ